MEINLVGEAFKFLVLGMSTVFMFLVLMVCVLELQSKIISKYFIQKKIQIHSISNDTKILATIAVALHKYQNSKR